MKNLQGNQIGYERLTPVSPARNLQHGLIAGLAGVIAMDLVMTGGLTALGLPGDTCFMTIGKTAARFFSYFDVRISGEVLLGVAVFHLLGPLLGAGYGLIVNRVRALQRTTLKKSMLWAVLFAEAVSQLILSLMPILLKMPVGETVLWFAGSLVLHAIWGAVMGSAAHYLARPRTLNYRNIRTERIGEIS
jgi:hypothetical protein